ncbi:hypothetical protein VE01_08639 [Pseudogymnoascus verrucosus]|uniref:RNA polymerase II associated protein 1 n=1 Tax=Pseudogymnoascus verrucosus TaxID=342668 RepID=A0A1B8GCB9_9PEZI|nr:uncharacterized protein VE01_08639 [Pseudogymnoascus verrucosus]OBT93474.1 hypothetical protein VE01_08639 [Pseudogymnoascus verrucosus]
MSARAERFILDLSDDDEGEDSPTTHPSNNQPSTNTSNPLNPTTAFQTIATPDSFIKDIIERTPSAPKPPSAPVFKQTTTGFPEHRKRGSRFKSSRGGGAVSTPAAAAVEGKDGISPASSRGGGGLGGRGGEDVVDRDEEERRAIDLENQKKIAAMSPEEIETERAELLSALDPNLVRMLMNRGAKKTAPEKVSDAALVHKMKGDLTGDKGEKREMGLEDYLKRANIDDGRGDTWVETPEPRVVDVTEDDTSAVVAAGKGVDSAATAAASIPAGKQATDGKKEEGTRIPKPKGRRIEPTKAVHWLENDEVEPKEIPELQPVSEFKPRGHTHASTSSTTSDQPTDTTTDTTSADRPTTDSTENIDSLHFPRPPTLPDLDPSSPNFLQDLHTAYFPSLPSSSASLAWLAPLPTPGSAADLESTYHPSQTSIPASSLRFDFKGQLLPPRISRAMPVDRGLHHHADAPEAGGYTISELSGLLRSSVPQQRGLAAMVLGRILYRLGKGEWGAGSEVTMGLWRCVEEGGVVGGLVGMAGGENGDEGEGGQGGERHRSVKAYATEAVWLWRMGGGKVMGAI